MHTIYSLYIILLVNNFHAKNFRRFAQNENFLATKNLQIMVYMLVVKPHLKQGFTIISTVLSPIPLYIHDCMFTYVNCLPSRELSAFASSLDSHVL